MFRTGNDCLLISPQPRSSPTFPLMQRATYVIQNNPGCGEVLELVQSDLVSSPLFETGSDSDLLRKFRSASRFCGRGEVFHSSAVFSFPLRVPAARRRRTPSLNISFLSEEGWRRRVGEAGDGVEASVKKDAARERGRGRGRGEEKEKALECYSVKVTQRRGGPACARLRSCVFNRENSPQRSRTEADCSSLGRGFMGEG